MKCTKTLLILAAAMQLAVAHTRAYGAPEDTQGYPLWVGGVQVTSETTSGDCDGGGTWAFAPATDTSPATLTLTNATITASAAPSEVSPWISAAIVSGLDLTVHLVGENALTNTDDQDHLCAGLIGTGEAGKITLAGPGSLTSVGTIYGVLCDDCALVIDGTSVCAEGIASDGIKTSGGANIASITITGSSVVTATGRDVGMNAGSSLTVEGSSFVTANGGAEKHADIYGAIVTREIDLKDGLKIMEPDKWHTRTGCFPGAGNADLLSIFEENSAEPARRVVIGKPPAVSNVVARQRWPWNGLVDVDYEVAGYRPGLAARISFAEQGGTGHWVATNFLAGAEPSAAPGLHRATWDTAADGATNVVAAEVTATVELVEEE